ncbi:armadillo repeat-containing protein 7 isoform X3 [Nannospalax galili]|uniref:armadillo repeat-containing protein 7 isoform X3 n=1 Tax=Nannospalax galili TaxID=1026970 RepID=UPI00111C2C34|nr:armadillo repeat-containing protein 7 isoform X3 [Nannospalax galili]
MAQKPKVDPHVGRLGYLQALVTEFQETESQDAKEQVLANLANFAYDPGNYQYLRQLQVLDLFLDSLSEENENLVKFAIGAPHVPVGCFPRWGRNTHLRPCRGPAKGGSQILRRPFQRGSRGSCNLWDRLCSLPGAKQHQPMPGPWGRQEMSMLLLGV